MSMHVKALVAAGCVLIMVGGTAIGHEDVIDKMPGLDAPNAPLVGQGKNATRDRAYAFNAQYVDNRTEILSKPNGKRWITVAEAIPWAKRVWNVNILDETDDPAVGKIRFATGLGAVEREFALPLFLEALSMAIENARQDCYVEHDLPGGRQWNTADYHRGTVHLRRERPLQADYDHPFQPDKKAIKELEASMAAKPALDDHYCAPSGSRGVRCAECQAAVARLISHYVAVGGVAAANSAEALAKIGQVCKSCRHCSTYWKSRSKPNYVPRVTKGTGVEAK